MKKHYDVAIKIIDSLKYEINEMKETKLELLTSPENCCSSNLICPLTREIFVVPITTECGHTFERFAILSWLYKTNSCPLCKKISYYHNASKLEMNFTIANLIDIIYLEYRQLKLCDEKYKSQDIQNINIIQFSFEYFKDAILKIEEWIDEIINMMIKQKINEHYINENEISEYIYPIYENPLLDGALNIKCKKIGVEMIYEFENVENVAPKKRKNTHNKKIKSVLIKITTQ